MSRPGTHDDLLRSARDAVASPTVRTAVRDVALTALRSRLLTAEHIAAVAKTIGEGIGSVDVTPTAPVRETYRSAWQGLEEAVGEALHALEAASREFAEGRAALTPAERERLLADIARMEQSLASGWDHRKRIPDSLQARIAAVTGLLRQAIASDREATGEAARDADRVMSLVASAVLRGPPPA
jgi:hypothetical protein